MTDEWDIPAGVFLPTRAWRSTRTEIILLAEADGTTFTYAFTPEDLRDDPEAGRNSVRREGSLNPTTCVWTPEALQAFLRLMRDRGFTELPAQDFRISSDGHASQVIGKGANMT